MLDTDLTMEGLFQKQVFFRCLAMSRGFAEVDPRTFAVLQNLKVSQN